MSDDFLSRLRESPKYQEALARARTPEERARIKGVAEAFVASWAPVLSRALQRAKDDPDFAEQLARQLIERQGVVTNNDPIKSGSIG